tara:strand:- start:147 stop:269 length:123 start_codon:yes stop_codon:yes gene_type:complete
VLVDWLEEGRGIVFFREVGVCVGDFERDQERRWMLFNWWV